MKKILSLILCITMVLSLFTIVPMSVSAESVETKEVGYRVGDYEYKILSYGTAEITKYKGGGGDVTIPTTLDGYSVTSIGNMAFFDCTSLKSVTIPNSVTSIDARAFFYCDSLTSITIPNSVTSIGKGAFRYCTSLKEINVSSGNSKYSLQDGVLFNKDKTEIIIYPAGKTDTSYAIPNSVTSIGGSAFSSCLNLTSITIPNSVTSIGDSAFQYCTSLKSITIPDSVTSIEYGTFFECDSLTSITIPDSVTSIGDEAFWWCKSLEKIIIPDSVTSIGKAAFYGCTNLTSITIPNSVTSIGNGAFCDCTNLTSITIPNSVTSIGDYAYGYYFYNGYNKIDGLTIYGTKGSEAERYANKNGFIFIEVPEKLLGDADMDGELSVIDATFIQKYLARMIDESKIDLIAADYDEDGFVSVVDATKIQKYLAGIK